MKKLFIVPFLIFIFPAYVFSFSFESIGIVGGIMYVHNPNVEGAPSPISPYIGMEVGLSLTKYIKFEPQILFWGSNYHWVEDEQIALPAEIESGDSVLMFNMLIDIPFTMKFPITEKLSLGWYAGPAFIFRFPIKAWGEGKDHTSDLLGYFFGSRFIFAEIGGLMEWHFSEKRSIKGKLDILYPIYHFWDGESLLDHFTVRFGVVINFLNFKS